MAMRLDISDGLKNAFALTKEICEKYENRYIVVEHLLCALMDNELIIDLMESCNVDIDQLYDDLNKYFKDDMELIKPGENLIQGPGMNRVLEDAGKRTVHSGRNIVDCPMVLVSFFSSEKSHALYFLKNNGLEELALKMEISKISGGVGSFNEEDFHEDEFNMGEEIPQEERKKKKKSLELYSVNLTKLAKDGGIDPIIGRENELQDLMRTLCRRKKNNPLLVGEPGVGKTAIAEGLALKIKDGKVPDELKNHDIYAIDMAGMIAGTKFRGEFEERLKGVLDELKGMNKAIIFIDEIHNIVGAGSSSGGSMDAANILKPALASGKLRCIGSTTYKEYKDHIIKDKALERRFQKVDVPEPSVEDTIKIIKGLRSNYEDHFGVTFPDEAIVNAVELSNHHITDRFLPDKAIDIIDEAGAANALLSKKKRKKVITVEDVEKIVARLARIPEVKVGESDKDMLKSLEEKMRSKIFGQDDAVTKVVECVKASRAGIRDQNRPVGSFLFTGPTGVGKTEVAKQLADNLGCKMLRFDMSEYQEKVAVSKLTGSAPGYVGYEEGGQLTEAVIKNPNSVILFDEIEKAHSDIYNVLLQVLDYGFLTDNQGRKADFRNTVIIMTSNVGASSVDSKVVGFGSKGGKPRVSNAAIEKHFSPEFRNRLDSIVTFGALDSTFMVKIVEKFINERVQQLGKKNIKIKIGVAGKKWIAEKGFDSKMGARPMKKAVETHIFKPLVDSILFGDLQNGGVVKVTVKNDELKLDIIV
jgi:ATP-dependent Clp protease ATP-binding subunit ClpA